jgi:hypothetical protein
LFRKALHSICILIFATAAHVQCQQVAFIGDDLTYHWQQTPQFLAHKNWLPYGVNIPWAPTDGAGTRVAYNQLQNIIASGQKPIIHLLVGQADEDAIDDGGNQPAFLFAAFATNMEKIITTAQAAHLKIIVGTIPYSWQGRLDKLNQWIFQYCNAHHVPVINYAFALNSGQGYAASRPPKSISPVYYNPLQPFTGAVPEDPSLTPAGYDLITDMAQTQIGLTAGTFRMTGGYLQSVTLDELEDAQSTVNGNSLTDEGTVQFTPWGVFSDGSTRILNNADQDGHVGLWTSSAPRVILMDQYGVGTAYSQGSADVRFIANSGVIFSGWTMHVSVDDPSRGGFSNY